MDSRTVRLLEFPRLLGYLSECALSVSGRRRCEEIAPFNDKQLLREQTVLLEQAQKYSREIISCTISFPELDGIFEYLEQERTVEEDGLWAVNTALHSADSARELVKEFKSDIAPDLIEFFNVSSWPQKTWQGINRCLSSEGEIRDESSPELAGIRQQIRNIHRQCTKKVSEYLEQEKIGSFLQEEYFTISADRYVLALKSNFKGKISGIIHDYSNSGETCYFEPMILVDLNNKLQELRKQEYEARLEVLWFLTSLMIQESQELQAVYNWLTELDVLRAKLVLSNKINATTLDCEENNQICLRQAKHPLLYLENEDVVPMDICLQDEQKGLIISGGNSGGKTVCLKTLGLIALMSLSALPVPVQENCTLPFWKSIYVFLGDEQSLQEHLSTFTAQIEYFNRSWPYMESDSLVLLDEFGSGTDPSQGAALAQAVMDWLLKNRVWFVAATHFPALKAYGLGTPSVRAASVLFDPETLKPLYKLTYDQVGASQALDVVREYDLPSEILQKAEDYLLLEGQESGNLLSRLNQLAVEREEELDSLRQEKRELESEKKRLKEKYAEKAQNLISDIRQTSTRILDEWRDGKLGRKKALKELSAVKKQLSEGLEQDSEEQEQQMDWESLTVGREIYCPAWGKSGSILEKDDRAGKIKVNLGGVKIWMTTKEITVTESESKSDVKQLYKKTDQESMGLLLDIRGFLAEEAEAELNKFLDKALIQGRSKLEIIHGRGTGALRNAVHDCLKKFSQVQEFYIAPEDRGGDGVTIVDLK